MTTTNSNLFSIYELEAYLGEFIDDYDVDAIIAEATYVDYKTGNRYWIDDIDLWEIVESCEVAEQA